MRYLILLSLSLLGGPANRYSEECFIQDGAGSMRDKFKERGRWLQKIWEPLMYLMIENNGVFWDVTPCGSCKNRRFGGT
jgi:hypothetical protein